MTTNSGLIGGAMAVTFSLVLLDMAAGQTTTEQQLQCYACGMPRVHPENDILGSYGVKKYNHSCQFMHDETLRLGLSEPPNAFLRSCPVGVKSCFGAFGFYDYRDTDPENDLKVEFLGCSEAKYAHSYGCDREKQNVDVRDKERKKTQVEIDMNLCFCSENLCNDPNGELLGQSGAAPLTFSSSAAAAVTAAAVVASWRSRP